jgi:NADH dehydrogenase (ubiquinone) Fe-S protein 6
MDFDQMHSLRVAIQPQTTLLSPQSQFLTQTMQAFRRTPSQASRSWTAARAYSNAPAAQGITGTAHSPKPASPIPSANPTEADPQNLYQAPNHPSTWSTSQNPKKHAFSGPRFEQVNFSLQPQPVSAMVMVAQDPVRLVPGRKATCDGGKPGIEHVHITRH